MHFHVVVVQKPQRNVQKSMMHNHTKSLFCLLNHHFRPSRCRRVVGT